MTRSFNQKVVETNKINYKNMIIQKRIAIKAAEKSAYSRSFPPVDTRNILYLNQESIGITFKQKNGKFTLFTDKDREWLIKLCNIMVFYRKGRKQRPYRILRVLNKYAPDLIPVNNENRNNPYNNGMIGINLRLTRLFSDGHDVVVLDRYEITMPSSQTSQGPEAVNYFTFNYHNPGDSTH